MNSLTDLINWLTSSNGGAFVLASWALSWGLEGTKFWDGLTSKARSLIILGLAMVIGVLASWLGTLPKDTIEAIDTFFRPVLYIVGAWLATQTAHRLDNLRR